MPWCTILPQERRFFNVAFSSAIEQMAGFLCVCVVCMCVSRWGGMIYCTLPLHSLLPHTAPTQPAKTAADLHLK